MRSSGTLICLASASAFGAMGVVGKLAYDEGATVGTLLATRFALAAVVFWAVTLAAGGAAELRALEQSPEVLAVHTADVPADVLARLDEPARSFAAAWNERRRPKDRPGQGASWDAPGFDPP